MLLVGCATLFDVPEVDEAAARMSAPAEDKPWVQPDRADRAVVSVPTMATGSQRVGPAGRATGTPAGDDAGVALERFPEDYPLALFFEDLRELRLYDAGGDRVVGFQTPRPVRAVAQEARKALANTGCELSADESSSEGLRYGCSGGRGTTVSMTPLGGGTQVYVHWTR